MLWFHNYKFHKDLSLKNPQNSSKNELEFILNCKYCKKLLSRKDNLIRHEKKCKNKKLAVLNSGSKAHLKLTDIIYKNQNIKNLEIYI